MKAQGFPTPVPPARAAHERALRRALSALIALVLAAGSGVSPAHADAGDGDHVQAAIPQPVVRNGFPVSTGGVPVSQPATMADLDGDGRSEIIVVDDQGNLHVHKGDGKEIGGWVQTIGGVPSGPIAVGDIDNDGYRELVSVTTTGRIRVFGNSGDLEVVPSNALPSPPVGGAILTELDRTGRLAIVVVTQNGQMYAFAATGAPFPGWPVSGSARAVSPPFAYIAYDNFPRIGYLGANPDRAQIFYTYAALDSQAAITPGFAFSPAPGVSGARMIFGLPDADHVYLTGRQGQLRRLDADVFNGATTVTTLNGLPNDSVLVQTSLFDADGDLVPELALLALRGDTLSLYLLNGANGNPLAGFPRRYLGAQPVGGIACADVGDNNQPEMIFNHSGDKVSCVRTNGTSAWILSGLPAKGQPVIGDLDNDGGVDLIVVTTNGFIHCYDLGTAGLGPREIEWANVGGSPRHEGRHQIRDRAVPRSFWPPPITPANAFLTRPVIGNYDGDDRPDVFWSDYVTGKTFGFSGPGGALAGTPQLYNKGAIVDAPALGDVTGDHVFEAVQSTNQGWLVWGDRNGTIGSFLVDNNRVLSPPTLADINNDGTLDAVVGSSSGRLYAVKLTPPAAILPGFPVTTTAAIALPAAVGDISGDGQTDIVVVSGPRTIYAYPRTGVAVLTGWPRQFASGNTLFQPILVPVAGQTGLRVAFGRSTGPDSVAAHLVGANGTPLSGWPRQLFNAFGIISGPVAGDFDNNGSIDLAYATGGDSVIVFAANGNRALYRLYNSPGDLEMAGMVDLDLDGRPEVVVVSDRTVILGIKFNGLTVRSFTRFLLTLEPGAPPAFGDIGNDGVLDMAASDLGYPILYSWGYGSWNGNASPWPMKGHDRYRTHAFSGPTVVGVEDPIAAGPPARGTGVARAVPNPSRSAVAFSHTRPLAGAFEASLFDVRGRLVRVLGRGLAAEAGEVRTFAWDGRDEAGAAVSAGIYFYQVRDAAGTMRQKIVRLP